MPVQKKLLLETLGRVGLDDEAELLLALGEMAGKWADNAGAEHLAALSGIAARENPGLVGKKDDLRTSRLDLIE